MKHNLITNFSNSSSFIISFLFSKYYNALQSSFISLSSIFLASRMAYKKCFQFSIQTHFSIFITNCTLFFFFHSNFSCFFFSLKDCEKVLFIILRVEASGNLQWDFPLMTRDCSYFLNFNSYFPFWSNDCR
jgi:hypothetical protein